MAYKKGRCWACNKVSPVDSHHIRPLEYGGARDGKQVNICSRCHDIVHREGEHYYKHGKYSNLSGMADSNNHLINLKKLTKILADAKTKFSDADYDDAFSHQRLTSSVQWDSEQERLMAHEVKRALGFTSLDRAMRAVIMDKYERLRRAGKI